MPLDWRPEPSRVAILEIDPELGEGIPREALAEASRQAVAAMVSWRPGAWSVHLKPESIRGHLGLLVVDGLVVRQVSLGARNAIEVLGRGDVLRPWIEDQGETAEVSWTVLDTLRAAVLDRRFADRVAPWRAIEANISDRLLRRARTLAFQLAVSHLVTVEERLLTLLWDFARRWGRMTPEGAVVRLPVTHSMLGSLVGARRPTVSTALAGLREKGLAVKLSDGEWLLRGMPPQTFSELHTGLMAAARSTPAGADGHGTEHEQKVAPQEAA